MPKAEVSELWLLEILSLFIRGEQLLRDAVTVAANDARAHAHYLRHYADFFRLHGEVAAAVRARRTPVGQQAGGVIGNMYDNEPRPGPDGRFPWQRIDTGELVQEGGPRRPL